MLRLIGILCLLGISLTAKSQDYYSYVSDRKFEDVTFLQGYNFVPAKMEIPNELEKDLSPGDYSFGITSNYLYAVGSKVEGVYNINNINTTGFGYQLTLMNTRNARNSGHLKIILNEKQQCLALIFRRSPKDPEIIFHMAEIREGLAEREEAFFTDLHEISVPSEDSLFGFVEINPFLLIYTAEGIQQRLQRADSTFIRFLEIVHIEGKPVDKMEKENGSPSEISDTVKLSPEDQKKVKITYEYVVEIKQRVRYDDGTFEYVEKSYPVKRWKERSDDQAGPGEEKYQIEIYLENGDSFYLYLLTDRTVSSFETPKMLFLMRGA